MNFSNILNKKDQVIYKYKLIYKTTIDSSNLKPFERV